MSTDKKKVFNLRIPKFNLGQTNERVVSGSSKQSLSGG